MTNPTPTREAIEEAYKKIDNLIFPSKEDSGIEHVDESYKRFMKLIRKSLEGAFLAGRQSMAGEMGEKRTELKTPSLKRLL